MPKDEPESWSQLVNLAKKAGAGKPGTAKATASKQFISHMRIVRHSLWSLAKTLLWRRLSLVAVIVALVLYLIARLLLGQDPAPTIPTPQPPTPLSS